MDKKTIISAGKPRTKRRFLFVILLLSALLLAGLFLNMNIGAVSIPPREVLKDLWEGICCGAKNLLTGGKYAGQLKEITEATAGSQILFTIRLPRMLLAAVLGGALSVAGYLLQVFFRNPIAGPFILGISSGAKMAVGIVLVFLCPLVGRMGSAAMILAAFAGALLTTSVVLLFSQRIHQMSLLLVVGVMIGYICSAVTDFVIAFADDHDIASLTGWSMGSFSGASWENVRLAVAVCLPGLAAAWLLSKPIRAYALGEEYARSMGVPVKAFRLGLILLSSLLSACVTALAGPVSFVGIAVPHMTRSLLKTSRPAQVIPASFLCGAVFTTLCDLLARTMFSPTELSVGTVTAAFGAPVVIYMMVRRRKGRKS